MTGMLQICPECRGEKFDLMSQVEIECKGCEGQGFIDEVTCDVCSGLGCGYCQDEGVLRDVRCPHCDAQGFVIQHEKCGRCRGYGTIIHVRFHG